MKKALTVEEQIEKQKERGMAISDEAKAKEVLLDIGYYRFGFYSFPFEISYPRLENRDHKFKDGTKFEDVLELYYFDYDLRSLLLHYINRIEVNIRTTITYLVSNHYRKRPTWFVDPSIVKADYIASFDKEVYASVLKTPVIKRHHDKYINDRYAPAWKTIEFMTLGNICNLFRAIKDESVKRMIANQYGCTLGVFDNYIETLRVLRNKCAHGHCLYNMNLTRGIKGKPAEVCAGNRHNVAGAINVTAYLLGKISATRQKEMRQSLTDLLTCKRSSETAAVISKCSGL